MFTGEAVVQIFEHIVNLVKSVFLVKKKIQIFATKLFCLEQIILVVEIDKSLGGYQKNCRCKFFERVTKIENIKTDSTKILRPTHFLFLNMLLSLT
jgi:hypothetical protein